MPIDGVAALAYAKTMTGLPQNSCLYAAWQAYSRFGAHSATVYPTATAALAASAGMHAGDTNPPAGYPVWYGPRNDGTTLGAAGDVGISAGGGYVCAIWGTAMEVVPIMTRAKQINRPYRGWTSEFLGNTFEGDDDMPTMDEFLNYPAYTGGPTISEFFKAVDQGGVAQQVWSRLVTGRTDANGNPVNVPAIQELADAKTNTIALVALVSKMAQSNGVDAAALAQQLAPLLTANLSSLSDADVQRIAKASADEEARRLGAATKS